MTYAVNEIPTDYGNSRSSAAARACFADAYNHTKDAASAVGRETQMIASGAVLGAMDECRENPVGTVIKAGTTVAVGIGLGTLAAAECTIIAGGATVLGVAFTGIWAAENLNPLNETNRNRFAKMGQALNDTWWNKDDVTFNRSVKNMREGAGPLALDVALMGLGGSAARLGGVHGPSALAKLPKSESALAPAVVPGYYESGFSGLGKMGRFIDEVHLFQVRHGKVTRHRGTPETIDALIETLNRACGTSGKKQHCDPGQPSGRDWARDVLVPPAHKQDVKSRTLHFQKHFTDQR